VTLSYREEKFKRIRKRWFDDPLGVDFPFLSDVGLGSSTCAEFVESGRFPTRDDWALNLERYGFADPHAIMSSLRGVFESAATAEINPTRIRDAAVVLEEFQKECVALVKQSESGSAFVDELTCGELKAEASAAKVCMDVLSDLAALLGISLPVGKRGQGL
jgi:hypothetical protein